MPFPRTVLAYFTLASLVPGVRAATATTVQTVFVIVLENHNFTSNGDTSGGNPLLANPAAPYLNTVLLNPGTAAGAQTSHATAYHNVGATPTGTLPGIHPSEPNYLWMDAGDNFGVTTDNDPAGPAPQVAAIEAFVETHRDVTAQHLTGLLQAAGISWRAYAEDLEMSGALGNPPLQSFSGSSSSHHNAYNGGNQWAFACKHVPPLFFPDTNGASSAANYAPLGQLASDLAAGTVAPYNLITPDLYNDMHTPLPGGFLYHGVTYTGDAAQVAQGDNFLSAVIPLLMASAAYRNGGMIVVWMDETEGTSPQDFHHTLPLLVISPLAKGRGYASPFNYTHSSDLSTLQKIFQVTASSPSGYLNDAAYPSPGSGNLAGLEAGFGTGAAYDLSDLLQPGAIPASVPLVRITAVGSLAVNRRTNTCSQTVTLKNLLTYAIEGPVYLAVGSLSSNTTLINAAGVTAHYAPLGCPYVVAAAKGLPPRYAVSVTLTFANPASGSITDVLHAFPASGQP